MSSNHCLAYTANTTVDLIYGIAPCVDNAYSEKIDIVSIIDRVDALVLRPMDLFIEYIDATLKEVGIDDKNYHKLRKRALAERECISLHIKYINFMNKKVGDLAVEGLVKHSIARLTNQLTTMVDYAGVAKKCSIDIIRLYDILREATKCIVDPEVVVSRYFGRKVNYKLFFTSSTFRPYSNVGMSGLVKSGEDFNGNVYLTITNDYLKDIYNRYSDETLPKVLQVIGITDLSEPKEYSDFIMKIIHYVIESNKTIDRRIRPDRRY